MGMEWFGPVLAVALMVTGFLLFLLSLGLFLYGAFADAKARAAQDRNPAPPAAGQPEGGQ